MPMLGFVARVANWLRGHHAMDTSPFDGGLAETETERPAAAVAVVDCIDDVADPGRETARFEPASRSPAVMQELMVRFTGATDALADIRSGLAGLAGTFQELPEVVRSQTRFLAAMNKQLQDHEVILQNMAATLREVPAAVEAQQRTLERTNHLLDENRRDLGPLTGGFHRLANTMQTLNESSERHATCLGILTERHERYLREQREAFRRHNRLVVGILAVTGVVALGGLLVALLAILK